MMHSFPCLKCLNLCKIIMFLSLTDHFLIRASAALEKLKLLCGEEKECSNPSNLLELYTQVLKQMWSLVLLGVCMCAHEFMWTWVLRHLCVFMWRSEVGIRCFLQLFSILILCAWSVSCVLHTQFTLEETLKGLG